MRSLLSSAYANFSVQEEKAIDVRIDGRKSVLFIDFFIPSLGVAIEVHGPQHYKYVPHFHGSIQGFAASRGRDMAKASTIRESGYVLVDISAEDVLKLTPAELLVIINKAFKSQGEHDQ